MKKIFLSLFLFFAHFISNAQTWQDTLSLIEKMAERYRPDAPGCQLGISRNGQVIFSRAWGMGDLEHNIPLSNASIIEAGSVSKQFTAAAILLLEQQGKLSVNDDVRKYVPELPDYGTPILLRQMMRHTSGLKDWGSVMDIAGWPRSTKTYSNDDALLVISRQKTLNHTPGAEYIYSNSNYNLFAIIVERMSGMSLAEFTRIHIFEPAGMKHTEWRNNFKKIVPNRAMAYDKSGDTYLTEMPNEYVYGNGGLLTTVEDLLKWNDYYLTGKFGNPSLLAKQLTMYPFNNGQMNPYGAGLVINSVRGWKSISHTGATASYRASLEYFPELGLSIAWLSNSSEFDGSPSIANDVRNLLVKNKIVADKKSDPAPFNVSNKKLTGYTGWYKDIRNGSSFRLLVQDEKLTSSTGGHLIPVAENTFMWRNNRVEIHPGKPSKLSLITPQDTTFFVAAEVPNLDEKAMNDYLGDYWSEEAEAKFSVRIKDGKLILYRAPKTEMTLTPTYKDGFNSPAGIIYFERDKKARVNTLKFSVGRARNVEFKKVTQ
ncbi:serine hydrolase domain-containing protein [Runella sp.]|jgi:CubicO group peptidase (beta-lactamase class C family)|uniref:serine hydrolase domain-containing protein n=1 Tax=Runella sp. TaxID=1960881 RepID=UPI00301A165D